MNNPAEPFLLRWETEPSGIVTGETAVTEVRGETSDEGRSFEPSTSITRSEGDTSAESELAGSVAWHGTAAVDAPYLARWAHATGLSAAGETSITKETGETSDEAL